ncbi:hypothetical protein Rhe02_83850 [Rhizocola hellebori]|uniref:Plasmid replication, integration and excision activator n=1 Tax=Rhizocola hellebori TaxID=1392758 RepID=A0A8J3VLM9_9ACTN|nr:transcriptional regulator [Rhizocola hellebori]GIH10318.1 hypothetical protein Rhe02_83850 [Rhizocola hellebori]
MAIKEFIPVRFELVFPHGAYLNSEVMPVFAYEDGKKLGQAVHPETGERIWSVTVIDGDPELKAAQKAVTVKLIAGVQPVPPAAVPGSPFTPVEFTDMVVKPYVAESGFGGGRGRLTWTIQARDIVAATV